MQFGLRQTDSALLILRIPLVGTVVCGESSLFFVLLCHVRPALVLAAAARIWEARSSWLLKRVMRPCPGNIHLRRGTARAGLLVLVLVSVLVLIMVVVLVLVLSSSTLKIVNHPSTLSGTVPSRPLRTCTESRQDRQDRGPTAGTAVYSVILQTKYLMGRRGGRRGLGTSSSILVVGLLFILFLPPTTRPSIFFHRKTDFSACRMQRSPQDTNCIDAADCVRKPMVVPHGGECVLCITRKHISTTTRNDFAWPAITAVSRLATIVFA